MNIVDGLNGYVSTHQESKVGLVLEEHWCVKKPLAEELIIGSSYKYIVAPQGCPNSRTIVLDSVKDSRGDSKREASSITSQMLIINTFRGRRAVVVAHPQVWVAFILIPRPTCPSQLHKDDSALWDGKPRAILSSAG